MSYQLWVNEEGTVLVRRWDSGRVEVCLRESRDHIWKAPIEVFPERR